MKFYHMKQHATVEISDGKCIKTKKPRPAGGGFTHMVTAIYRDGQKLCAIVSEKMYNMLKCPEA